MCEYIYIKNHYRMVLYIDILFFIFPLFWTVISSNPGEKYFKKTKNVKVLYIKNTKKRCFLKKNYMIEIIINKSVRG